MEQPGMPKGTDGFFCYSTYVEITYVNVEMHFVPSKQRHAYSAKKLLSLQLNGVQSGYVFAAVVE